MAEVHTVFGEQSGGSTLGWISRSVHPALVASFVFLLCLEVVQWVQSVRRRRVLPGPVAWPLLGNALQLGSMPHLAFTRLAQRYGDIFQIRLGCSDVVVLNGESVIRQALVQNATTFAGRPDFVSFGFIAEGKSLSFSNYSHRWKIHRRVTQNAVRAFSLADGDSTFQQHVAAEAAGLAEILVQLGSEERYFNPSHELTVAAANVICALCFGKRYGHHDGEFRALLQKVGRFGETVGAGSLVDVLPWLQRFPNPVRTAFNDFKSLNQEFFAFVKSKVDEHRATFNPEVSRDISDVVLSSIGQAGSELSEDHGDATVADLIGAGLDTVSTALHWILLLLAKHSQLQTRLQQQLDGVVGRDRLPSLEDRPHLAELDAFIYETMRYTSFVPVTIPHSTTADVSINGLRIAKDTVVFINQWSVNHDATVWHQPHLFDPSRFLDVDGALDKKKTNQVMIFSSGKRRCVGEQIAKVEVFLFAAILIHQCRFEKRYHDDFSLKATYGLTLKPLDYQIIAKQRK